MAKASSHSVEGCKFKSQHHESITKVINPHLISWTLHINTVLKYVLVLRNTSICHAYFFQTLVAQTCNYSVHSFAAMPVISTLLIIYTSFLASSSLSLVIDKSVLLTVNSPQRNLFLEKTQHKNTQKNPSFLVTVILSDMEKVRQMGSMMTDYPRVLFCPLLSTAKPLSDNVL